MRAGKCFMALSVMIGIGVPWFLFTPWLGGMVVILMTLVILGWSVAMDILRIRDWKNGIL